MLSCCSRVQLCDPTDRSPPGKNTGVGCHALLQRIFSTQGSNPHLLGSRSGRRNLRFWATSREAPFSAVAMPIPILASGTQEFPFLHILAGDLLLLTCVNNSPSNRREVISHYGFDLHLLDDEWCWTSFCIPIGHLYVFFRKCLSNSSAF